MDHPSFELLLKYEEGTLEGEEKGRLDAHLASSCAKCEEELAWVRTLLSLLVPDDAVDAPPHLRRQAVALLQQHRPSQQPRRRRRIKAHLVFGGQRQPGPVGVRGGRRTRQWLFTAAGWDIDLQVSVRGERQAAGLLGQILPPGQDLEVVSGRTVHLVHEGARVAGTMTDHLGRFSFQDLAAGVYGLSVGLDLIEIEIEGVEV